jgi:hypothetical protein
MASRRFRREGIHHVKFKHSLAPENRVQSRHACYMIVFILTKMCGHHGNKYTFVSQEWLLKKLERWYGIEMARRTLCRHMNALQQDHWIQRTRRIEYTKKEGLKRRSTLYHPGARQLAQLGSQVLAAVKALTGARTTSRVPELTQYQSNFLEVLSYAARLSTARGPPNPKSSPPQKRGG